MATMRALKGTEDDHEWIEVEAWPSGVPGLRLTRSGDFGDFDGWWTITHERSGRSVGPYLYCSRAAARRVAQRLGPLLDWAAYEGGHNSITGEPLDRIKKACKTEARHVWDVWWETQDYPD